MPTANNPEVETIIAAEKAELANARLAADVAKARTVTERNKAAVRLLAQQIGLDPDKIKAVPTGDPSNPYRLEGISDLLPSAEDIEWDTKEKELTSKLDAEAAAAKAAKDKEIAARGKWVETNALTSELRQAFSKANAVDTTGDKSFADLIELTRDRVKVTHAVDPVTGKLAVQTDAVNAAGKPCTVPEMVAEWLSTRPGLVRRAGAGATRANITGVPTPQAKLTVGQRMDLVFGKQQPPQAPLTLDQRMDRVFGKLTPQPVANFKYKKFDIPL
jgi:hypothetical protein